MDWTAILLTARLAACTTAALFVLGVPLAFWLATTKRRFRFLVEALVALPIILPPTVIGFYILWAGGPQSPIGRTFEAVFGHSLPFSFTGILVGSALYNLPFSVRPFTAAFAAVDRRLVEASWCLGASSFATFVRVILPLSWPGILTGMVLTFAHTVGEFGVVMMLGGNIPGVTRTISVAIYDDVQALNYVGASQTSLLLVGFALVVLCTTSALQKRVLPL